MNSSVVMFMSSFFSYLLKSRCVELCLVTILFLFSIKWYFKNKNQFLLQNYWPIMGHIPSLMKNAHCVNQILLDCFSTFGPSFKLKGPNFTKINYLVTCHPNNIEYILKTNFSNFPKGQGFKEIFDIFGDGIFSTDFEPWSQQRKMLHSRFSAKEFKTLVSNVNKLEIEVALLPLLLHLSKEKIVFDLQSVFLRLAFDTSFTMTFGKNPKYLSVGFPSNKFAEAIEIATETMFYRHVVPNIWWRLLRLLRAGQEKRNANARRVIDENICELISLKKQQMLQGVEVNDLLSTYMIENDSFRSEKFLRDTSLIILFAAADTSASGLTWFFWSICNNPHVEAKIMEELKQLVSSNGTDHSKEINKKKLYLFEPDELRELVYLNAALYESLRLYPPGYINHKGVVKEDKLPDGKRVRPGMKSILSIYASARMESVWGKDCKEYKPERWIDEQGMFKSELLSKFFVFNVGPRTCMGKEKAMNLMKSVIAAILYNFHVQVVEGEETSLKESIVLLMKDGLKVKIRERVLD